MNEGKVAVCPTDPTHDQFVTVTYVMQDWIVGPDGRFIEALQTVEVIHGPDRDRLWTCYRCGSQARMR